MGKLLTAALAGIGGVMLSRVLRSSNQKEQGTMFSDVVSGLVDTNGGFGQLTQQLHSAGMENQLQSWVGKGQNEPVTAQQVEQVPMLNQLANKVSSRFLGGDRTEGSQLVAGLVPSIVNEFSPQGTMPSDEEVKNMRPQVEQAFLSDGEKHTPKRASKQAKRT